MIDSVLCYICKIEIPSNRTLFPSTANKLENKDIICSRCIEKEYGDEFSHIINKIAYDYFEDSNS